MKSKVFLLLMLVYAIMPSHAQVHVITKDVQDVDAVKELRVEKKLDNFFGNVLHLTPDQDKAFKKLDLESKKNTLAMRNQVEIKRIELSEEMMAENPSEKKLHSMIDEIYRLDADIEKDRISTRLKKRALLTDEQKKVYDTMDFQHAPFQRNPDVFFHNLGLNNGAPLPMPEHTVIKITDTEE